MIKTDPQIAIEKATELYWEKGFHATSMRALQEKIDMRPGSIYAAFGSKEGLFKRVLEHYADQSLALLATYRQQHESPLQAIKSFVHFAVIERAHTAPNEMCLLVKSISELTEENNADLLATAKQALAQIESAMADFFRAAIEAGEIDAKQDPQSLASMLQVHIIGLRTYRRLCQDKQRMLDMIDHYFAQFDL
ncbi:MULTISPECIES: TetR/AcrR family transcriptional regulator [unclassified Vibrio]|uniref:TetR/AcrR family transcriptional regulator n=1 Tax=Vibrio sp. HB236076 TaxID=3232307 RepID=A0AB39HH51_9VIBR|nr:TetR/AcrR family transcriptional regulator [Vibrio sp. HB161653]MDP5255255.1 TetR family transcriptional regulator [Vibrio sp. HB161653]